MTLGKENNIRTLTLSLSVIFIHFIIAAYFLGYVPQTVLLTYLIMSLITYIVYGVDKSKAKRKVWRIRESTLHLLALMGGWPGAAIAQQVFRHKINKVTFKIIFWFIIAFNIAALSLFISSQGRLF